MFKILRHIGIAVLFMSRIPLPLKDIKKEEMPASIAYLPLVGLLLGSLVGAAVYGFSYLWGEKLAIAMGIAFYAWLTRGIHEDGLADTFDGLGGGQNREKALEIMRDSRIGSFGSISLILLFLLRFISLEALKFSNVIFVILLGAALSRLMAIMSTCILKPARAEGMGYLMGEKARWVQFIINAVLLAVGAYYLFRLPGIYLLLFPFLAVLLLNVFFHRRLGGYTGDILGAVIAISELLCWISAVGLQNLGMI